MSLKVMLKRGESLLIGTTQIRVMVDSACLVLIDGDSPVLRQEDAISIDETSDTLDRLHHCLQRLYLEGENREAADGFEHLIAQLRRERPDLKAFADEIERLRRSGKPYKAVKSLSRLNKIKGEMAGLTDMPVAEAG